MLMDFMVSVLDADICYWYSLYKVHGPKSKPFWGYRASYAGLVRYIYYCPVSVRLTKSVFS